VIVLIHVSCFSFGHAGAQNHGRNFIHYLNKLEPVALTPWDEVPPANLMSADHAEMLERAARGLESDINIGIGNIHMMDLLMGEQQIAFVVWETTIIPEQDLYKIADVEQIWTPSTWSKQILVANGVEQDKIRIVPEGIDPRLYKPLEPFVQKETQPFRFLFVGKWEERKGIDILLSAYADAFNVDDSVELILQSQTRLSDNALKKMVEQLQKEIKLPIIAGKILSERAIVHLYNYCDALVLPTRAEGWGLPIIEAMACAKPVITTNYSGHLEYANHDNAYLIEVKKMVEVNDPHFYSQDGRFGEWAEPDIQHLSQLMRHVYENQDEARMIGKRARQDIEKYWTWDMATDKAWREITHLRADKHA